MRVNGNKRCNKLNKEIKKYKKKWNKKQKIK
jgi:hypothetical protein